MALQNYLKLGKLFHDEEKNSESNTVIFAHLKKTFTPWNTHYFFSLKNNSFELIQSFRPQKTTSICRKPALKD